jgi:hypothetical protein
MEGSKVTLTWLPCDVTRERHSQAIFEGAKQDGAAQISRFLSGAFALRQCKSESINHV